MFSVLMSKIKMVLFCIQVCEHSKQNSLSDMQKINTLQIQFEPVPYSVYS